MRAAFVRCVFAIALASAARAEHRGLPVLTVLPQSQHHGGAQTFDVTQDARGILYFGNLAGVLTYDGAWWRKIALPNDSAVFAVASDSAGLVAAGGVGELGYLATAPDGTLAYHSLMSQLPANARDVGEVRGICTTGRGFVFTAEHATIEWNGGAPRVIPPLGEAPPQRCEVIDGAIHLWGVDGLLRLENGRLVRAGLAGTIIDAAVDGGGRAIVAVRNDGLVAVKNGLPEPFAPEGSDWLRGKRVTDACRLRDGRIVVTTREDGVLLLRPDGAVDEIIEAVAGLPEEVLSAAAPDREGALWLAYHGPIVRVDLASPVTVLDRRRGVYGNASSIRSRDGKLWMTTSHGLFVIDSPGATARRVAGVAAPAWATLPDGDALLVGTSDGVYRLVEGTTPERIAGTQDLAVYDLVPSHRDPRRIWLATRASLGYLQREGGGWRYAAVPGTPRYVRSVVEENGVVWAGSVFDGVIRVDVDGRVSHFGSGEMEVYSIANRVVLVTAFKSISIVRDGRIVPDPLLGAVDAKNFFVVAEDAAGNVWLNSEPPRVAMKTEHGYARETRPLTGIGTGASLIRVVEDGSLWFATSEGFFRYASTPSDAAIPQPSPLLRRVMIASGDALDPTGISLAGGATSLRHAFGRLRIEFAPASYRPGVAYQYRLDPLDQTWSEWTSNSFIDYTHLDAGDYTFRIRARGATGAMSQETQWSFTVRPPWYRTPWAMLLFVLAGAALIAAIVKLRTRALRRRADRLVVQVEERTRELARTVDLLGQANAHLERLSLLDELTGIPNRRYFDRALAQAWDEAVRTRQPLSLIFLDLDHFKSLNDQRGHPAGDASLVQVARLLARKIRRSGDMVTRGGDVVARIGGEEFAILLTGTDAEGATRIAESLRASVEELAIAFESVMLRVTVSCGVASMEPLSSHAPDILVRRADRALYAAKAAGRNCVRGEQAA